VRTVFRLVLLAILMATPQEGMSGTIPETHSALLLAKCLPYNDEWAGRTSIHVLVLASGKDAAVGVAEVFAGHLQEIGTRLQEKDPSKPRIDVTVSTLHRFELDSLSTTSPQLIFLAEGEGPGRSHDRETLKALSDEAERLGILIFTDSRLAFNDAASIYFALGANSRPEIYGEIARVREQGGKMQGPFLRLLKRLES